MIAGYLFAIIATIVILLFIPFEQLYSPLSATILVVSSYFAYYIIMEIVFQKTLGKFITKTKVVTLNGQKPKEREIILRTFCRLIPFDHISFLFSKNGFHDHLSRTKVIKESRNSQSF